MRLDDIVRDIVERYLEAWERLIDEYNPISPLDATTAAGMPELDE